MARFILAFKKFLNLIKFVSPSQDEYSELNNSEAILHVHQAEDGTSTLIATFNSGETLELLSTEENE